MKYSLVFFGSGPVAAKSLEALVNNFRVEAVVTKSAKHQRDQVPVLELAKKLGIKSFTPAGKLELDQLIANKQFSSKLGVIVDYGIIVGQSVIDSFELGIVNSHFSLLPQWRGADPISFAILSGQKQTGVSLMVINDKMDEGPLLAQEKLAIAASDTGPSLTNKLITLSDSVLGAKLPEYASGELVAYPQESNGASYSRKLTKQDGQLDFNKPAEELEREIRAFIEWPKSRAKLAGLEIIVVSSSVTSAPLAPGEISASNGRLLVGTRKGSLAINQLKPVGKSEMSAAEFLRGYANRIHKL